MSIPLKEWLFALILAGAVGTPIVYGDDAAPAGEHTEICQTAQLRNGFTLEFSRREERGPVTRLWICGDYGGGYVQFATEQIEHFEQNEDAAALSPAPPAAPQPIVVTTPPPERAYRNLVHNAPIVVSSSVAAAKPAVTSGPSPAEGPYRTLIDNSATRNQIDPDFVASVVKAESAFNPQAVSPKGALGLMQLMPQTAASLGVRDAFDPASNVEGGTRYLRLLLDHYRGDALNALAAYNAGPERVEYYGGVPPYRETRAFVARVIDEYNRRKTEPASTSPAPNN